MLWPPFFLLQLKQKTVKKKIITSYEEAVVAAFIYEEAKKIFSKKFFSRKDNKKNWENELFELFHCDNLLIVNEIQTHPELGEILVGIQVAKWSPIYCLTINRYGVKSRTHFEYNNKKVRVI